MNTLAAWRRLAALPAGRGLFSRVVCFRAPYFASIRPTVEDLRPEYCRVRIAKRRAVLNHIGTVHAIAMCNAAELAGGLMTDVTIPSTHRWIPSGMTVRYLRKATTDLVAVATPQSLPDWTAATVDFAVRVEVQDLAAQTVFDAVISMRVSLKR